MAAGSFAGPSRPTQPARSNSATPCSCAVGTSGKKGVRVAVETARMRTRPVCMCGVALAVLVQPTGRWPATTSFISWPPERYCTSGVSMPVRRASSWPMKEDSASVLPVPTRPGLARAKATICARSAKGCAVPAASTMVLRDSMATGVKSVTGS